MSQTITKTATFPRAHQVGGVIVRGFTVRPGVHRVTVEYAATGGLIDQLCRSHDNPLHANQAVDGIVHLLTAGWTLAALIDFANTMSPAAT